MMALAAYAVPADPKPATITQPDGAQLTLRLIGDEFYSYSTTIDGYTVMRNAVGGYEYARATSAGLAATGVLAHNPEQRSEAETSLLLTLPKYATDRAAVAATHAKRAKRDASIINPTYFNYDGFRGLIILVNYTDVKFTRTDAKEFYQRMTSERNYTGYTNEDGSANPYGRFTGSVRDYYYDNSMGQFDPQFDVVGPVNVNYNSTSGRNNSRNVFIAALNAVDAQVDFRNYDHDNDGYVDMVYFIVAGHGSNTHGNNSQLLWPYKSTGLSTTYRDTKRFNLYACSTEMSGSEGSNILDGIGTICHEFGHVIGLPDLYDTDYEGSGGESHNPGLWDIMSGGSYLNNSRTPAGYTIWERYALGWAKPVTLDTAGEYTLNPVNTSNEGYILRSPLPQEFFMLDNRQNSRWDAYLPGHGMTIVRVDSSNYTVWRNNDINNNPYRNYYEMLRAGNTTSGDLASDPYPGSLGVMMVTPTSEPGLRTWAGDECAFAVNRIIEKNGVISFQLVKPDDIPILTEDFENMPATTATSAQGVEGTFSNWNFTRCNVVQNANANGKKAVAMKKPSAVTMATPIKYNINQVSFSINNPTNVVGKYTLTYSTDGGTIWTNASMATNATTFEAPARRKTTAFWQLDLKNTQSVLFRVTMSDGNQNTASYLDDFTIYYYGEQGTDKVTGDVTGDGKVDIDDVNTLINVMLGKATNPDTDITGDGKTDVEDINTILNIILSK